jgi:23S rRNA (guanine745-N1)-methyltransferase
VDARLHALAAVAGGLRCPNCAASLSVAGRTLACAHGHAFDLARQGYVALTPPRHKSARGDSANMVAARESFLTAGHYAPIAAAITAAARAQVKPVIGRAPLIVDLGAGTGYYLAALLQERPDWRGLALDASRPALRRALGAHPRIAAVACDVWQELPVQDGRAALLLNVFAPRNGPEIARVLAPGGALIVVTPTPRHLRALSDDLGLLEVDADKQDRLRATLSPRLEPVARRQLEFEMTLPRSDVQALITMGPSAHHLDIGELADRLSHMPESRRLTASLAIETFRHREPVRPSA